MRRAILSGIAAIFVFVNSSQAAVTVAAGESIQKAIDAAPEGEVISIAEGTFPERLTITKSLTLQGAGWDKTIIKPDKGIALTQAEKDEFFRKLEAATSPDERMKLAMEIAGVTERPTITVKSARDVKIEKLKVQGRPLGSADGKLSRDTLVLFDRASASISDCVVIGPYMNGIDVAAGSDVEMSKTLVAAFWGTGVQVYRGAKAKLSDSDIRNCYHRCVTIGSDATTIENCRISGSAWHAIRYDHCSPTIVDNHLFGNARFGIYANGKTTATVRDNVFAKNEMSGMSCWSGNRDTIEGNTFVDNVRSGIEVIGASEPALSKNVFVRNPVAVWVGKISGQEETGQPKLEANTFWENKADIKIADKDQPLPEGNKSADPKLADAAITPKSTWAIQPEEKAIIPESETRDFSHWKKVASAQ